MYQELHFEGYNAWLQEGYDAICPYPEDSVEEAEWNKGFDAASYDFLSGTINPFGRTPS